MAKHSRVMIRAALLWHKAPGHGTVSARNGTLGRLAIASGKGRIQGAAFRLADGPARLEFSVSAARVAPGSGASLVSVCAGRRAFTFFLRDVQRRAPIFFPDYGVIVTPAADRRTYEQIAAALRAGSRLTDLARIEAEPEETCADAAAHAREMSCWTWLGLSRDMRLFEFGFRGQGKDLDWIQPRWASQPVCLPECNHQPVHYELVFGRGIGCVHGLSRRLEDGVLPILLATLRDGDVVYSVTAFAGLERGGMGRRRLRGTDHLVADGHGYGHMFTPEQQAQFNARRHGELALPEEVVLFCRIRAENTAPAPRYAWLCAPSPIPVTAWHVDAKGFGVFNSSGRVFAVNRLNGRPMPDHEVAILLPAGGSVTFEMFLPHRPVTAERAARLARANFEQRHAECRAFWNRELRRGARIRVPEKRVDEMTRAGLLHLDLVAYGREPSGPIAPSIGVYCPIGSESSPIIQFFDSMGWHDVARRAIEHFFVKQHPDGFIQNFGGYMLETGPALWTAGEHYRYTRDLAWVKTIEPNLLRACEFMLAWRKRNKTKQWIGRGYGLQEGKVADPPDRFHSFMLNGYAYLGLRRAAEMLARVNPRAARRLAEEALAFKRDIRRALFETMARSPLVPLGDGRWCPSCAPWAEGHGPMALYVEPARWFTHGTFTARDSLLGPLYLVFQEVLDPSEPAASWLLQWHSELMCARNVAFSQPYYSRHPEIHLLRGEVKPFLKAYYNGLISLADRETYTWWEHYFRCSPHKTHEEAWHLMQTRRMLWLEQGDTLKLLPGIPRRWLADGGEIALERVASYFGPLSLRARSIPGRGILEGVVSCPGQRRPGRVMLRLPHPRELRPVSVEGGAYVPESESVRVDHFKGSARVRLRFAE